MKNQTIITVILTALFLCGCISKTTVPQSVLDIKSIASTLSEIVEEFPRSNTSDEDLVKINQSLNMMNALASEFKDLNDDDRPLAAKNFASAAISICRFIMSVTTISPESRLAVQASLALLPSVMAAAGITALSEGVPSMSLDQARLILRASSNGR